MITVVNVKLTLMMMQSDFINRFSAVKLRFLHCHWCYCKYIQYVSWMDPLLGSHCSGGVRLAGSNGVPRAGVYGGHRSGYYLLSGGCCQPAYRQGGHRPRQGRTQDIPVGCELHGQWRDKGRLRGSHSVELMCREHDLQRQAIHRTEVSYDRSAI